MSTRENTGLPLTGNPAATAFLAAIGDLSDLLRLTERDYIDWALEFASSQLPVQSARAYSAYRHLMTGRRMEEQLPLLPSQYPSEALQEVQARFIGWLEILRQERRRAMRVLGPTLAGYGGRMVLRPTYIAGTDALEVSYQCYPADFDASLGFVLMLLLDPQRPFFGNLCRCGYSECQRFFLAVKPTTGRPRRDYCSQDHFERARTAAAAARIRAYRQRQREKPKPTRRKPK